MRQLFYCGDAYATVVSVDRKHGGTVTIPFTPAPESNLEKQRCADADSRRQMRLQVRIRLRAEIHPLNCNALRPSHMCALSSGYRQ